MQNIAMIVYVLLVNASVFSIKPIEVPFSNSDGVPFYLNDVAGEIEIANICVDGSMCIYIAGGEPSTIVKYTVSGKLVFRKVYPSLEINRMHYHKGNIYVFDSKKQNNTLYVIDSYTGQIKASFPRITDCRVNSCRFNNDNLILHVFDTTKQFDLSNELINFSYSLEGKFLGIIANAYGLVSFPAAVRDSVKSAIYLGTYKDYLVFNVWNADSLKSFLIIVDSLDRVRWSNAIPDSMFGQMLLGGIGEHWYLNNGYITVIGRKKMMARLTTFKFTDLFPE